MRKLWLALALLGLAVAPASAQQTSTPMIGAIAGAYNGVTAPNITAGKFGLVQIDSHGNLVVSCTNCGAASITGINVNGPFNVTVTNNATGPVIVSSPSGFGTSGSAVNATITNTVASPVLVSNVNQTYAPQGVTVLNTAVGPVIVSSPSGFGGAGGTTNATITNTAGAPVIVSLVNQAYAPQGVTVLNTSAAPVAVSILNTAQANAVAVTCTNCGASTFSSVTIVNTAAVPAIVSVANTPASPVNVSIVNQTYGPQGVTVLNTSAAPVAVSILNTAAANALAVTCLNCGAASITNVTVVNAASSPVPVSIVNQTYAAQNVTVTNATALGAAASAASSPVVIATDQATITVRNVPALAGGLTMKLLNGLTTTKTTIKSTAGQLVKVYCYNPNSSVAYVQIFDALTGSVTLGTTSPSNSLGIPATSAAGFALGDIGDQFATAISVAATTTVAGLTAPSSGLDCNASYN